MSKRPAEHRQKQLTRKQISRRQRERRARQRLLIGAAVVLGLVILILAWGLYDQYVLQPARPVAIVSGEPISLDTYQKLVTYQRWEYRSYVQRLEAQKRELAASENGQEFLLEYIDQQISQVQNEIANLPFSALDELIDNKISRQECARRGITVSADEVQSKLEEQFGYERNPPTPVPITSSLPITITPTPTEPPMTFEQFGERSASWFRTTREATGFDEADFRELLESSLYKEKLEEAIKAGVPTRAEQIHAHHILLKTREEAEDVLARLQKGEDFATLATALSEDSSNKDDSGDLGWFPRGQMVPEFEQAAFALQPGELSGVLETNFGFHVIQVLEREDDRELDAAALQTVQGAAVDNWFAQRRQSEDVVRKFDSTMIPKDTGR